MARRRAFLCVNCKRFEAAHRSAVRSIPLKTKRKCALHWWVPSWRYILVNYHSCHESSDILHHRQVVTFLVDGITLFGGCTFSKKGFAQLIKC